MTISLISLIDSAHARYTEYFADAVTRAKSENPDVVSEFLIPLSDDSIPFPYRHFRADLMGEDEDDNTRAVELWQDPPSEEDDPHARAYAFNLGTVRVEVHPFTWCAAQITFDHALSDESLIADYLEEWMDPQDRAYDNGEPFAFAIHSATQIQQSSPESEADPETATGRSTDLYAAEEWDEDDTPPRLSTLTLDLGTAPAEALLDLIERLTHDGATEILIRSNFREGDDEE
ncbi:hypothetical protein [Sphingopyxis yananensis]|uniref:hypothetical protein n=1 Tax=Sphingopyxis yananensis TaxID=2886687 RepID=UPI001D125FE9|nr:hypothetical protein [Sphingopyxis yananensis]MCC2601535.1 hypothetical protein [Sphingopyxis yananensis]